MRRRRVAGWLAAAIAGIAAGSRLEARVDEGPGSENAPKHVCKGLNACKGQGGCEHGCGNHGCHGKNDCKGKGGCAAEAAKHACKGQNACKGIGGCDSGDQGCAGRNTCKGNGGCKVPLKIEHAKDRERQRQTRAPGVARA
jgi:hypothetical protein